MLMVTTANVTDRTGALDMAEYYYEETEDLSKVKKFLVDSGYSGENFADEMWAISEAEVEVVKRNELHKFVVLPKRWIVERTFGWLDKYRRLWKNCERKLRNSSQMLCIAFIRLLLKRSHFSPRSIAVPRKLKSRERCSKIGKRGGEKDAIHGNTRDHQEGSGRRDGGKRNQSSVTSEQVGSLCLEKATGEDWKCGAWISGKMRETVQRHSGAAAGDGGFGPGAA